MLNKYTPNDGLSSYYITKILQDHYGFLWIGTQEGLNRFDGQRFEVFSRQSSEKHRLGGSFIYDLAEDRKRNLLWVAVSYGDICAIDLNTRTIKKRILLDGEGQPLSVKWLRSLYIKGDTLWMGGHNALYAYNIETGKYLDHNLQQKAGMHSGDCNISTITADEQSNIWLFSDGYGTAVLSPRLQLTHTFRDELAATPAGNNKLRFWSATWHNNVLYAATSWGLRMFQQGRYLGRAKPELLFNSEILSLSFSAADTLLFSTPNRFYAYNLRTHTTTACYDDDPNDDWFTFTYQTWCDPASGRVWIGTLGGLAGFSIQRQLFRTFSRSAKSNTRIKHLYAILPVTEQDIYSGDENGLYYTNTVTKETEKIDSAASNLLLFKDNRNHVFVSNKKGFFLLQHKQLLPAAQQFPCLAALAHDHLSCGIQYNDSLILFGSIIQKGLSVWNTRKGTVQVYHNDSTTHRIPGLSIINSLYRTKSGQALILTEKAILGFDPITRQCTRYNITYRDTLFSNFMDICETADRYWIATYGNGIIETDKQFRVKRVITAADGLSNNCVYKVFAYQDKQVIATTNNGLSVMNIAHHRIRNYYQYDGLHSNAFEQLCGYQANNKIYAGGVNGFTEITPAYFSGNAAPPAVYFDNIHIDARSGVTDTTNLSLQQLVVPSDVVQTTVSFAALNYQDPHRVEYAYRIPQLNSNWISLGNQHFINLIGLAPGKYTLLIKAANEDRIWNEKPLQLSLIYLPEWYQSLWFKILVVITVCSLVYAFIRYRFSQLRKQQQIRKEIAGDLHDDIGSILNSVKIFAQLAKKEPQNADHLNQIESSLSQATLGLRDMIWVLDDNQDTIFELSERIKKFALPVCQANQIKYNSSCDADNSSSAISKTEKRNLLLIAKETINNSIKYAACSNIQVALIQQNNHLQLTITDDGIGFVKELAGNGYGLKNMEYRAKQISCSLQIVSTPGKGTMVKLEK